MKTVATLGGAALGLLALRAASRRLATHQAVLPQVSSRINTRVIRVNQDRPMPPATGSGSVPSPSGDALP